MEKLITVTIKDAEGNHYSRQWKATANRLDVIRWITESADVPHYLNVKAIVGVTISETED